MKANSSRLVKHAWGTLKALCGVLLLWGMAAVVNASGDDDPVASRNEVRPGEEDPVANPARRWLFRQDALMVPGLFEGDVAYRLLTPVTSNLSSEWTNADLTLISSGCQGSARRYARGRIVTPERDQLVCVTNSTVSILAGPNDGYGKTLNLPESFQGAIPGFQRPVSVAVGRLDDLVDKDGVGHDSIVLTYKLQNGHIRLLVLNWNLEVLAKWDSPSEAFDADVTLADLDAKTNQQIVLALFTQTRIVELRAFSYRDEPGEDNSPNLEQTDIEEIERAVNWGNVPDDYASSLTLRSGDLDGDGIDEVVLAYHAIGQQSNPSFGRVMLRVLKKGPNNGFSKRSEQVWPTGNPKTPRSYFDLAVGLFRYDPANHPDDSILRHDLAIAWFNQEESVDSFTFNVKILRMTKDLRLTSGSSGEGWYRVTNVPFTMNNMGPGIAVGNFIGHRSQNRSPIDQLAISVPEIIKATIRPPNNKDRIINRVHVFEVGNSLTVKMIDASPKGNASNELVWNQTPLAVDLEGKSYFLGAPVHIVIEDLINMHYVMQEPPKHVDCNPQQDDSENVCKILDISGYPDFSVRLSQTQGASMMTTGRNTTSWDIGAGGKISSASTVSAGFGRIASVSIDTSLMAGLTYDYNEVTEKINEKYHGRDVATTVTTSGDDVLIYEAQNFDIWRYPLFGWVVNDKDNPQGFYEIVIPGSVQKFIGDGADNDWYQPVHENKNILSYPTIPDVGNLFVKSVGSYTSIDQQGTETTTTNGLLAEPFNYTWGTNELTHEINWMESSSGSVSKSYRSTLGESLDIGIGFSASVRVPFAEASSRLGFDFNFQNKNSWENSSISLQTNSGSKGISLNKPANDSSYGYKIQTAVYVTKQGTFRVAHAVNPTGVSSSANAWRALYGNKPNPALNLPNRIRYEAFGWQLNNDIDQRKQLRGFFLRSAEVDPVTEQYNNLAGAIRFDIDEVTMQRVPVRLTARVYNTSLHPNPVSFQTRFEVEQLDLIGMPVTGTLKEIGSADVTSLQPMNNTEVSITWDPSNVCAENKLDKLVRFWVTVNPDNTVSEIHPLLRGEAEAVDSDNQGFWPWSSGVKVECKNPPQLAQLKSTAPVMPVVTSFGLSGAKATDTIQIGEKQELEVAISSPGSFSGQAHLMVTANSAMDHEGDPTRVVASRVLYGLPDGGVRLRVPWNPSSAGDYELNAFILDLATPKSQRSKRSAGALRVKVNP